MKKTPSKPNSLKPKVIKNPAWKRKIFISSEDNSWVIAHDGMLLINCGSGVSAIDLLKGEVVWEKKAGRGKGSITGIAYGRVMIPRNEKIGGLTMLDYRTGKEIGSFGSFIQNGFCREVNISGKQAVVINHMVLDVEGKKCFLRHDGITDAFEGKVLYEVKDEGVTYWACAQLSEKANKDLWRIKWDEMGRYGRLLDNGLGIFYSRTTGPISFPGHKDPIWAEKMQIVDLNKGKVVWSRIINGDTQSGFFRPPVHASGSVIAHCLEVCDENKGYQKTPFRGATAFDSSSGNILWVKAAPPKKWMELVAAGEGRFWFYVETMDRPKAHQLVAVDAATGAETISIPISGNIYDPREDQGMLAFQTHGNILYCYNLTE